jgi:hypothetical protein
MTVGSKKRDERPERIPKKAFQMLNMQGLERMNNFLAETYTI